MPTWCATRACSRETPTYEPVPARRTTGKIELDAFLPYSVRSSRTDLSGGDAPIPEPNDTRAAGATPEKRTDFLESESRGPTLLPFPRLERAALELLARYEGLHRENTRLAEALAARDRRIEELESRLRDGSQLQRDVAKRIDDLVGQIDQVEFRFAERGA